MFAREFGAILGSGRICDNLSSLGFDTRDFKHFSGYLPVGDVSNTFNSSQTRVGFVRVYKGSFSISEYEIGFLKWGRHTPVYILQSMRWYMDLSED